MTCANTSFPAYIICSRNGPHRRVANLAFTVQVGDRRNHEKLFAVHSLTRAYLENVGTLLLRDILLFRFDLPCRADGLFLRRRQWRSAGELCISHCSASVFASQTLLFQLEAGCTFAGEPQDHLEKAPFQKPPEEQPTGRGPTGPSEAQRMYVSSFRLSRRPIQRRRKSSRGQTCSCRHLAPAEC